MKKRNSKNLSHATRRQALALAGSCGIATFIRNPVDILLNGLTEGIIQKAQAAEGAVQPRNHIYFYNAGGPLDCTWLNPHTPYSPDTDIVKHPHINTRFANAGAVAGAPQYAAADITRNGATVRLPWLWNSMLPTVGGGQVPMADLAANLLIIRGVNMTSDGHDNNAEKQIRPISGSPSLNGAVADRADSPVPAVTMSFGPSGVYKSDKGIGQFTGNLGNANPLAQVLTPFNRSADANTKYLSRRDAVQAAFDQAMRTLGNYASSANPGADSLFQMRHSAEALLKQGIGDTAAEYTALRNKYRALIEAVAISSIPGVTDKPIPFVQGRAGYNFGDAIVRNPDFRTLIGSGARPANLAEGCAVAEYLITRGYSRSVCVGLGGTQGVRFENILNADGSVRALMETGVSNDEHGHGSIISLLINSFMYRAESACIYELIQSLKRKGLWENSVIQIGSEFGRIPRDDQSGADHGWSANRTGIFSGAINQPLVLGNMLRDASMSVQRRMGSWGVSGNVKVDGGDRNLHVGNTTSTLAHLLRIEPLMPNYSSLVVEEEGKVTPTIELATNK